MYEVECTPDSGDPFTFVLSSRDNLEWEEAKPGRNGGTLDGANLADTYEIAFYSARRRGLYDGTQADFKKTHDIALKPVQVGPTKKGR